MVEREDLRREVLFKAVRSRGPGGQNVNRTASAAQLVWDFETSALLSEEQKRRLHARLAAWINSENQIYLRGDEFRDLERNKTRCLEKLADLVNAALHVPKKRRPTRPTRASRVKRRESKTRRAETKRLRGKVKWS
jgi:ribosome-associated protein